MKFVCDACGARYRIDEERVRGKVPKVRCKRCAHIITVRAPRAMESERPESAEAVEWHVAVNGVTEGRLTEALVERFRSGSVGDEAHVWNDTFRLEGRARRPGLRRDARSEGGRQSRACPAHATARGGGRGSGDRRHRGACLEAP